MDSINHKVMNQYQPAGRERAHRAAGEDANVIVSDSIKITSPPSNRKITDTSARQSCEAVSTTLCRIGCSWSLDRLIVQESPPSPSAVPALCSARG
jgi:hypothetical protein